VSGVGAFFAVVLAELLAGGLAITWSSPLWDEAKRSYFTLYSAIALALFGVPTWLIIRSVAGDEPLAQSAATVSLITAMLVAATWGAMALRRQIAARVLGIASIPVAIAVLVQLSRLGAQDLPLALVQVGAGAFFLGAVYDALFLGHWYLTDRKLTRVPIQRATTLVIIACVVELVAIVVAGFGGGGAVSTSLNPVLAIGDVAPWIAIGMAAATLLIALLAKAALRGQRATAVQSATGFYYLALLTAIVGEVAVKTRFFPG
jgi:hypothetical protein